MPALQEAENVVTETVMSFPAFFFGQVKARHKKTALRRKEYGVWNRISWAEYGERVREAAAGLVSMGVKKGDRVAILGDNRPEWLICHLAAMTAGGVTCGVYPTAAPDQVAYVVSHSDSRVLFVENAEQVDKVLQILPDLKTLGVIVWDPKRLWGISHPSISRFSDFMEAGRRHLESHPDAVSERLAQIVANDTAMMIYTSGTTGRPKGAMISHRNILQITSSLATVYPFRARDEILSSLPLAHIYENLFSLFQAIRAGATVSFVESMETLAQNLREVSPTVFCSVPRIWEKFLSMTEIRMSDSTPLKRWLYAMAVGVGLRYVRSKKGSGSRFSLSVAYWPLYWLVLYPLKRQLGFARLRVAVCGAAPASPELFKYYNALGIPLREGYGQTESTGLIAVQHLDHPRWGYVGEPVPGVQVKIAEDGEILARGPGVFQGYYKDPELTSETVKDGWLHTGDIGVMSDGHLKVLDRKKDIIITAEGKNIAPALIENKLKFTPFIQDAVVMGGGKKGLVALILIDEENVTKYAQDNRIPFTTYADLTQNLEINKLIDAQVSSVNTTLPKMETVKRFVLLPRRFYEEDGDVAPTKRVKRCFLEKRYQDLIQQLYQD